MKSNFSGNISFKYVDTKDWYQNEFNGNMYYNSSLHGEQDASKIAGEGWSYFGENGVFGKDELALAAQYNLPSKKKETNGEGFSLEISLKGADAKGFMQDMGYEFMPVLFKYHSDVTTEYHPEVNGQITISHDNSRVESVLSSRYISQDLVLKETLTLKSYNKPQNDPPKWYGPMYSIRDQSWTYRKNIYGTHAFGRKFGKTVNTLQKILPWKGAYENLWKKALK